MAKATNRATALTTLVIGQVKIAVGLFSTVAAPSKLADFDTGGPNGGVLKAQPIARAVPVDEQTDEAPDVPVHSVDPFADPGPDLAPADKAMLAGLDKHEAGKQMMREGTGLIASVVDGQYGRELVEEGSGKVVLPQDVRRGIRLEDGRFIDCTDQIAQIDDDTRLERIDVLGFVDITRVHRARVKAAQYVGAGDEQAPYPLRGLYEAMKRKRRGALVKLTKKSRQTLGVIGWLGGSLVLYELVWAEDFREAPARAKIIQKAAVSESLVDGLCDLIEAMAVGPDAVDELRDDAIALREELRAKALAGEVPDVVIPPAPEPEVDVMAMLEASLAEVS